jgi:hypothetical protein
VLGCLRNYGSIATLQVARDRLAGCSSWPLRFAVYSSGGNLSRRSFCEDFVPGKLPVPADLSLATHPHAQHRFQRTMKLADPALLFGDYRLVVDVGIADEKVSFKLAGTCHLCLLKIVTTNGALMRICCGT